MEGKQSHFCRKTPAYIAILKQPNAYGIARKKTILRSKRKAKRQKLL